jgi:hypothetical protein
MVTVRVRGDLPLLNKFTDLRGQHMRTVVMAMHAGFLITTGFGCRDSSFDAHWLQNECTRADMVARSSAERTDCQLVRDSGLLCGSASQHADLILLGPFSSDGAADAMIVRGHALTPSKPVCTPLTIARYTL